MAKSIDPKVLKQLRDEKGLSMSGLAEKARVDTQTIYRIEHEPPRRRQQATIAKLCQALGVEEGVLTGEIPLARTEAEDSPIFPRYQLNCRITAAARNAYSLVAMRYKVPMAQIAELAPFLFLAAAENSLQRRRERLDAAEAAVTALGDASADFPHLPRLQFFHYIEALGVEHQSIATRDIFGRVVGETPMDWGDEDDDEIANPFEAFLREMARQVGAEFSDFEPSSGPEYRICQEDAAAIVGGDAKAAEAILSGSAQLHAIPKDILKGDSAEARAAWVKEKAAEFEQTLLEAIGALDL